MNLKRLLIFKNIGIIIILLLILSITSVFTLQNRQKLEEKYDNRLKSIEIANALRTSSDDLTRYCRTYVSTGDSIWEQRYWDVLAIRNGKKPWPNGRLISMQDSMQKLGFTKQEFDKLKIAEKNSNGLVYTEKVAFNAMKGIFANKEGNFVIKGKPDVNLARRVTFDKEYHDYKAIIMKPIDDFYYMFLKRVNDEVSKYQSINNRYVLIVNILIVLIIILSIVSYFNHKNKQLEALRLSKTNLEKSEKKFRELYEKSSDAILIIKNGLFSECNKAAVQLLQYKTKEDLLNTSPANLSPKQQPDGSLSEEKAEKMMHLALKKGTHRFEWIHKKLNGRSIPVEVLLTTIANNTNNKIIHCVWRDITERKKGEEDLKNTNQDLRELVYIALHDLQVPLVSIEGYTSEVLENYKDQLDEEGVYCLKRMQSNAQRMHKLVLSLLDISRINTHINQYEKFDLTTVLDKITQDLSLKIEEKKAVVNHKKLPTIYADKLRIEVVLRNIITNALNYNGKNINITFKENILAVADDGIGVPQDQLKKIFSPGERLKMNKAEGVGMGLAFCNKVIAKHKGAIWAESEGVGKGTTIKIKFNKVT